MQFFGFFPQKLLAKRKYFLKSAFAAMPLMVFSYIALQFGSLQYYRTVGQIALLCRKNELYDRLLFLILASLLS